ncbi:hypothetical protein BRC88_00040 [Halobacteriales archaeon QS_4_69_225]|nr:MAG: hypothetical protein BRC88_00040 [Halobacteriales archaeon QS_4_69_225]
MPHQCTGCGERFADGSKEMLSGCPECGGNKFQFRPQGADVPEEPEEPKSGPQPEPADDPQESSVAETVGRATTRVRDFVSGGDEPDPNAAWPDERDATGDVGDDGEIIDADARREAGTDADAGAEDAAQVNARSGLAAPEDVPDPDDPAGAGDEPPAAGGDPTDSADASDGPPAAGDDRVVSEPSDEDPDLAELREQLNDQFESIKIVEPGQYELNLMELYDREEYIIALQENGRYVIQVPDQWIGADVDDR